MDNQAAVSPIVATLVLIVVAVVGAVAVGSIMGTFSSSVSKQANTGNAASASQTEILIAGSTTVYPASVKLAADYENQHPGIKITVQQGGSGAGVQSTALGIADIGAISTYKTLTDAQTANPTDQRYQNIQYTQIGGAGVVWAENGASAAIVPCYADIGAAYTDATAGAGTTAAHGVIPIGTIMLQRQEASSGN